MSVLRTVYRHNPEFWQVFALTPIGFVYLTLVYPMLPIIFKILPWWLNWI